MRTILKHSWQLYRQNFAIIFVVVIAVWTPLELLSSYMDAFIFEEDDFQKSWRFALLLENLFGIIATAGVIHVGHAAIMAGKPTVRTAFAAGFSSWWRMWWTRFLFGIVKGSVPSNDIF